MGKVLTMPVKTAWRFESFNHLIDAEAVKGLHCFRKFSLPAINRFCFLPVALHICNSCKYEYM